MTTDELIQTIEGRADLAPFWANVFEHPGEAPPDPGDRPDDPGPPPPPRKAEAFVAWQEKRAPMAAWELATARHSAWAVKVRRVGWLHPDAAHEIGLRLGVDPKLVLEAKKRQRGAS